VSNVTYLELHQDFPIPQPPAPEEPESKFPSKSSKMANSEDEDSDDEVHESEGPHRVPREPNPYLPIFRAWKTRWKALEKVVLSSTDALALSGYESRERLIRSGRKGAQLDVVLMTVATPHIHKILMSSFEGGTIKSVRYYLPGDDVILPSDEGVVGNVAYDDEHDSSRLEDAVKGGKEGWWRPPPRCPVTFVYCPGWYIARPIQNVWLARPEAVEMIPVMEQVWRTGS